MKYRVWVLGLILLVGSGVWWRISKNQDVISPGVEVKKELPYEKYSFENLVNVGWLASSIEIVGDKFYYLAISLTPLRFSAIL